jgi:hypothetical protein
VCSLPGLLRRLRALSPPLFRFLVGGLAGGSFGAAPVVAWVGRCGSFFSAPLGWSGFAGLKLVTKHLQKIQHLIYSYPDFYTGD